MRALRLCEACKRHVRVNESACPFCGAEQLPPRVEAAPTKPRGRPGGRAALFLAGAAATPSCALEQAVPVYGVPIDTLPDAGPVRVEDRRDAELPMAMAVYGIPIQPDAGVPERDAAAPEPDAGEQNSACGDAGAPMAVPVYGVSLDPLPRDAGNDGGRCGPGSDGSVGMPIDAGGAIDGARGDEEILGVPVYGLWLEGEAPEE